MKKVFVVWMALSSVLSLAQAPDFLPQEDLIAWYAMGAGSMEESGLVPLQPIVFAEDRFGEADECILFDGEQELTTAGLSYSDFTISLWFRGEASSEDVCHGLISQNTGVDCTPLMHVASCNIPPAIRCQVRTTSCVADQVSAELNVLSWQHLVFQRQGNTIRTFLNGDLAEEGAAIEEDILPDVPLRIGSLPYGGQFRGFNGLIDDVAIWGRSLSEEEVLALHQAEQIVVGCQDVTACNYSPEANVDDDSCTYPPFGLTNCEAGGALCGEGTAWDEASQSCVVANVSDTDFDGCVGINDFLIHLSNFGSGCGPELAWSCGDPLEFQGYDYETVQIGGQCWFAENLRSDVYQNGDAINSGLSTASWQTTAFGATAVYGEGSSQCTDNDPGDQACDENWAIVEYGRLYNFLAVDDERGLCPQGWHVPTDEEFQQMEGALGMSAEELSAEGYRGTNQGDMLKTQFGWFSSGNGTNEVSFNGEASGFRGPSASFLGAGVECNWWTADAAGVFDGDEDAWSRTLRYNQGGIQRYHWGQGNGFSVRCIQDSE